MGHNAYVKLKEKGLTWEENATKLHEIYEELLARRSKLCAV